MKSTSEHRFNLGERCQCGIRADYLKTSLAMLDSWPKREKDTEEWRNKRDRLLECPRKVIDAKQVDRQ